MDGVSFGLTLAQTVEICIKLGKVLVEKIQAYRKAQGRIGELVVRITLIWAKTEAQISFLHKITDRIPATLQSSQEDVLQVLILSLQAAINGVHSIVGTPLNHGTATNVQTMAGSLGPLQRAKYALFENHLQKCVNELEAWQNRWDFSWFLITLIADVLIDKALDEHPKDEAAEISILQQIREAVYRHPDDATAVRSSVVRHPSYITKSHDLHEGSSYAVATTEDTSNRVLVETTTFPEGTEMNSVLAYACDLARILAESDPSTLGLLRCLGIIKVGNPTSSLSQVRFLFEIPALWRDPTSLRESFSTTSATLNDRVEVAKSLARSIMAVHSAKFVHKSVRPENIVIFRSDEDGTLRSALIGFERFRPEGGKTGLVGDMIWERNLYRHPRRQGIRPEEDYYMRHDIYSLGVCLLEIGLWISFVSSDATGKTQPAEELDISAHLKERNPREASISVKQQLAKLAETKLAIAMGRKYTDVVQSCLACLDKGVSNVFGTEDDLEDENGVVVGVRYIELVLVKLEEISV